MIAPGHFMNMSSSSLRGSLRLGAFVLGLALALAGATASRAAEPKPKVGDAFPDLAGFELEGPVPKDLKGKVVLIDFWASWCLPCKQALKAFAEFHRQWADRGFVVVAVSTDTKKRDMDAFLKKNPLPFVVLRDAKEKLAGRVDVPTMPTSYLLDRAGRIAAIHEGYEGEETRRQFASEIATLLDKP